MKRTFIYIVLIIGLVASWEYFGQRDTKVRLMISSPTLIIEYFIANCNNVLRAVSTTLFESISGVALATCFSYLIMFFCLLYPQFLRFILPIFVGSQVIPIIAIAPLLMMIFGLGLGVKIVMTTLVCFFPIFMNFLTGINSVPSTTRDLLYVYNVKKVPAVLKIYFPLSIPFIFAGLKISAPLSVIGAIVAEFNGAQYGLGKNLFLAAKRLEPELLMTSLLFSIILGILIFLVVRLIEKRLGKWYLI